MIKQIYSLVNDQLTILKNFFVIQKLEHPIFEFIKHNHLISNLAQLKEIIKILNLNKHSYSQSLDLEINKVHNNMVFYCDLISNEITQKDNKQTIFKKVSDIYTIVYGENKEWLILSKNSISKIFNEFSYIDNKSLNEVGILIRSFLNEYSKDLYNQQKFMNYIEILKSIEKIITYQQNL